MYMYSSRVCRFLFWSSLLATLVPTSFEMYGSVQPLSRDFIGSNPSPYRSPIPSSAAQQRIFEATRSLFVTSPPANDSEYQEKLNMVESGGFLVLVEDGTLHFVTPTGKVIWSKRFQSPGAINLSGEAEEYYRNQGGLLQEDNGTWSEVRRENTRDDSNQFNKNKKEEKGSSSLHSRRFLHLADGHIVYQNENGLLVPLSIHVRDIVHHSPFSTALFPSIYFLGKRDTDILLLDFFTGDPVNSTSEEYGPGFKENSGTSSKPVSWLKICQTRWLVRAMSTETHTEKWRLEWKEITPIRIMGSDENVSYNEFKSKPGISENSQTCSAKSVAYYDSKPCESRYNSSRTTVLTYRSSPDRAMAETKSYFEHCTFSFRNRLKDSCLLPTRFQEQESRLLITKKGSIDMQINGNEVVFHSKPLPSMAAPITQDIIPVIHLQNTVQGSSLKYKFGSKILRIYSTANGNNAPHQSKRASLGSLTLIYMRSSSYNEVPKIIHDERVDPIIHVNMCTFLPYKTRYERILGKISSPDETGNSKTVFLESMYIPTEPFPNYNDSKHEMPESQLPRVRNLTENKRISEGSHYISNKGSSILRGFNRGTDHYGTDMAGEASKLNFIRNWFQSKRNIFLLIFSSTIMSFLLVLRGWHRLSGHGEAVKRERVSGVKESLSKLRLRNFFSRKVLIRKAILRNSESKQYEKTRNTHMSSPFYMDSNDECILSGKTKIGQPQRRDSSVKNYGNSIFSYSPKNVQGSIPKLPVRPSSCFRTHSCHSEPPAFPRWGSLRYIETRGTTSAKASPRSIKDSTRVVLLQEGYGTRIFLRNNFSVSPLPDEPLSPHSRATEKTTDFQFSLKCHQNSNINRSPSEFYSINDLSSTPESRVDSGPQDLKRYREELSRSRRLGETTHRDFMRLSYRSRESSFTKVKKQPLLDSNFFMHEETIAGQVGEISSVSLEKNQFMKKSIRENPKKDLSATFPVPIRYGNPNLLDSSSSDHPKNNSDYAGRGYPRFTVSTESNSSHSSIPERTKKDMRNEIGHPKRTKDGLPLLNSSRKMRRSTDPNSYRCLKKCKGTVPRSSFPRRVRKPNFDESQVAGSVRGSNQADPANTLQPLSLESKSPISEIPKDCMLSGFLENGRFLRTFTGIQLIGEGGFGTVYRVNHRFEPDSPEYAVKFVTLALKPSDSICSRRYFREVSANRDLFSQQVVRYFTWWCEEPQFLPEPAKKEVVQKNDKPSNIEHASIIERTNRFPEASKHRRRRKNKKRKILPELNCRNTRWMAFSSDDEPEELGRLTSVGVSFHVCIDFITPNVFKKLHRPFKKLQRSSNRCSTIDSKSSAVKKQTGVRLKSPLLNPGSEQVLEDDLIVFQDSITSARNKRNEDSETDNDASQAKFHCILKSPNSNDGSPHQGLDEKEKFPHGNPDAMSNVASNAEKPFKVVLLIQMELVSGMTLRRWLDRFDRTLSVQDVVRRFCVHNTGKKRVARKFPVPSEIVLFRQLMKGLRDIHAHGIVHRDIKPENIFVNQNPLTLKIGDFGLARFIEAKTISNKVQREASIRSPSFENTGKIRDSPVIVETKKEHKVFERADSTVSVKGLMIGTPAYTAPEGGALCTEKADVFSAALILLELLCPRFKTVMERNKTLENFRNNFLVPEYMETSFGTWVALMRRMGATDPADRPSAASIYKSIKFRRMPSLHVFKENRK